MSKPERVPLRTILLLSAPAAGEGFMLMLISLYLMKFATDVLGMAPAVMGGILLLSRVSDAVTDPLAGYWSDRTRSRWGRRRPWMLVGAVPVGICFALIWSPPTTGAGGVPPTLWMGAAVLGFFLFRTIFALPHDALAAELSTDYLERNRIFGIRRAIWGLGAISVFVALAFVGKSEEPRALLAWIAGVGAIATTLAMLGTAVFIRERPDHQGRGSRSPLAAITQVLSNRNARILLGVFFLQQIGVGGVMVLAAYYAEYVHDEPEMLAPMMGLVFVGSVLSIPLWLRLGRRFEKKTLLLWAMTAVGACLSSLGLVAAGDRVTLYGICALAGLAVGALDVLSPSLQADVIDSDEVATGERKEGVYFAGWHLAAKTALGVASLLGGLALSVIGLQPGTPPSPEAVSALRLSISLIPGVAYAAGILLFTRFGLTRSVHDAIREHLDGARYGHAPGPVAAAPGALGPAARWLAAPRTPVEPQASSSGGNPSTLR